MISDIPKLVLTKTEHYYPTDPRRGRTLRVVRDLLADLVTTDFWPYKKDFNRDWSWQIYRLRSLELALEWARRSFDPDQQLHAHRLDAQYFYYPREDRALLSMRLNLIEIASLTQYHSYDFCGHVIIHLEGSGWEELTLKRG